MRLLKLLTITFPLTTVAFITLSATEGLAQRRVIQLPTRIPENSGSTMHGPTMSIPARNGTLRMYSPSSSGASSSAPSSSGASSSAPSSRGASISSPSSSGASSNDASSSGASSSSPSSSGASSSGASSSAPSSNGF